MSNFLKQIYEGPGEKPDLRKMLFVLMVVIMLVDYFLQMFGVIGDNLGRLSLALTTLTTLGGLYQVNKYLEGKKE